MELKDKIVKLRKEKGWTQYRLYKTAGMNQSTLSRIESGENKPTFENLQKIATALGVSIAEFDESADTPQRAANKVVDLVIADMDKQSLTAKEEQAAQIFKSLSKEDQQKMLLPFIQKTSANTFRIDEKIILQELKSLPTECQQAIVLLIKTLASSQP